MKINNDLITVCDKCFMASCWQGIWMCDESQNAGVVMKPRAELIALGREHPSYLNEADARNIPMRDALIAAKGEKLDPVVYWSQMRGDSYP